MKILCTDIPDVKIFTPDRHGDDRGFFSETWNRRRLAEAGIDVEFVQDNHVLSPEVGTLRGLHFQAAPHAQGKLVRVAQGAIFDVAVDIRHGSPSFGRHVGVALSRDNWQQLWVPPGFAHGYCTLEPDTEVLYKVTDYWAKDCEGGIRWNDPALGIAWPVDAATVLVAPRDQAYPTLAEAAVSFRYGERP